MPPDILGTLEHIHEAAGFIEADTAGMTFETFKADRRTRQAVERNFEIIGEAVNRLRRHAPEIVERVSAFNKIVGLRNVLIHGYDRIDFVALWFAVQESLPLLRAEVDALLRDAEGR
ncbi:MAG: DUF86 domain-containing protein [Chloroflexia bacterium]|nr:DUF86 domain-containing protein [Chloroflexia bacterium]